MTHFVKYLFGRPRRWRREMTQAERVQGACAAQNGFPLCQLHRINDGVNGDDDDDDGVRQAAKELEYDSLKPIQELTILFLEGFLPQKTSLALNKILCIVIGVV